MASLFGGRSGMHSPSPEDILRLIAGGRAPGGYGTSGIGDGHYEGMRDIQSGPMDSPYSAMPMDRDDPGQMGVVGAQPRSAPPGIPAMGTGAGSVFRPALPDFSPEESKLQLPDMTNAPRVPQQQAGQMDPRLAAIVGQAPVKRNNTGRDILAGVLATIGDTLSGASNTGHGRGGYSAVDRLTKQWVDRRDTYKDDVQNYETRKRMAEMPGMTERELQAFALDPKAWAGSMAKDATSKFGAATMNPGDVRNYGYGAGTYQAPTRGEQYAQSIGGMPGSEAWNNAIRDQELGSNGPTAFGNTSSIDAAKAAQSQALERLRQTGRMTLQGARVAGQQSVKRTPSYGNLNPPMRAPRVGRGAGSDNLPVVRTPADAAKLPSGSRFRTPDGRVMEKP